MGLPQPGVLLKIPARQGDLGGLLGPEQVADDDPVKFHALEQFPGLGRLFPAQLRQGHLGPARMGLNGIGRRLAMPDGV